MKIRIGKTPDCPGYLWEVRAGREVLFSGHADTKDQAERDAQAWILSEQEAKSDSPAGITEAQERVIGNRMARALRLRRVLIGGSARWSLGDGYLTKTDVGIFRVLKDWAQDLVHNRCPKALEPAGRNGGRK